jgi:hypothetical protein
VWFIAGTTCRLYRQHVVFQTRDGIHQGILHSVRDGGILVRPVGGSTTRACRHRGEVGLVVVRSSDVTGAQKQDVGAGARPGGRQSAPFPMVCRTSGNAIKYGGKGRIGIGSGLNDDLFRRHTSHQRYQSGRIACVCGKDWIETGMASSNAGASTL